MTDEDARALTPGQTIYIGHLTINPDGHLPTFAADITPAVVIAPLATDGFHAGEIRVTDGTYGDPPPSYVTQSTVPEHAHTTRADAVAGVRRELAKHLVAGVEFAGKLADMLAAEVAR
jgi:hypothetical protein